ncbi:MULTISPECIES: hypothetical protein [Enterococcus]|uniref:DUF1648 domain-containing protein n=1 Tax=Enterococcus alishanensis TaxID=1303817 RepID=A0ABS6TG08_9ENTE|nr:hypothetical protein [Enterococcus alishanensis]MBV7391808.1 hypothetical protein [Enterococcus alishanensis]
MEELQKHLKKVKTWNMVLLVIELIVTIISLIGLPTVINPNRDMYYSLGSAGEILYKYLQSPMTKVITIVSVIISIVIVILFVRANKTLKEGNAPAKWPYYLKIGWSIINTVITYLTQPNVNITGAQTSIASVLPSLIFQIILLVPAVIVIIQLFKIEPEE